MSASIGEAWERSTQGVTDEDGPAVYFESLGLPSSFATEIGIAAQVEVMAILDGVKAGRHHPAQALTVMAASAFVAGADWKAAQIADGNEAADEPTEGADDASG